MIDFSTLQGLTIPEGVVTQITDASGRVLWMLNVGGPIILEVEKVNSDVYAGETLYTGEQFILLDIYPKTNGTVKVTYGGLTKTITDTSGNSLPNAQQVFFGTFAGVSDSVETPSSGEVTIEGDCRGVAQGAWKENSKSTTLAAPKPCVTGIKSLGAVEFIPGWAFYRCEKLTNVRIPKSVTQISGGAFGCCPNLSDIVVDSGNKTYISKENAVFVIESSMIFFYPSAKGHYVIPSDVKIIGACCFDGCVELTSVTIPSNVETINMAAFQNCPSLANIDLLATTPPFFSLPILGGTTQLQSITVPAGYGEVYKTAEGWIDYADLIVEAS